MNQIKGDGREFIDGARVIFTYDEDDKYNEMKEHLIAYNSYEVRR